MSNSRVSHACRSCAKARVKCEETKPCSRCRARNISCQPSSSIVATSVEFTRSTIASTPLAGPSMPGFEPGGTPGRRDHNHSHGNGPGPGHDHGHPQRLLGSPYQSAYGSMIDPTLAYQSYPTHFSVAGSSTTGITSHAPMPFTTTSAYAQPGIVMRQVAPGPGPNPVATSATATVTAPGASFPMAYYPDHDSHHQQDHQQHLGLHTAVPGFTGSQTDSGAPGQAANGAMGRLYRESYAGLDAGWPANPTTTDHSQGAQLPDMNNAWAYDDFDLQNLRHW